MNIDKQRIVIAKICGWKTELYIDTFEGGSGRNRWKKPNGEWYGSWEDVASVEQLPDYLNDLNAMHEAEKMLTIQERHAYSDHLHCEALKITEGKRHPCYFALSSTSAQRAEAFLKVLGKWETEEQEPITDKERIDWWEKHPLDIGWSQYHGEPLEIFLRAKLPTRDMVRGFKSFREAIDFAIDEERKNDNLSKTT